MIIGLLGFGEMTLADRVVMMNEGMIEQIAARRTLCDCLAKLFVASFTVRSEMTFCGSGTAITARDAPL